MLRISFFTSSPTAFCMASFAFWKAPLTPSSPIAPLIFCSSASYISGKCADISVLSSGVSTSDKLLRPRSENMACSISCLFMPLRMASCTCAGRSGLYDSSTITRSSGSLRKPSPSTHRAEKYCRRAVTIATSLDHFSILLDALANTEILSPLRMKSSTPCIQSSPRLASLTFCPGVYSPFLTANESIDPKSTSPISAAFRPVFSLAGATPKRRKKPTLEARGDISRTPSQPILMMLSITLLAK